MLEISFSEKYLRNICENSTKAETALGIEAAIGLRRRLADIRAAANAKELVTIGLSNIKNERSRELFFNLGGGFFMTIVANYLSTPILKSGKVDWKKVQRVKVIGIERAKNEVE